MTTMAVTSTATTMIPAVIWRPAVCRLSACAGSTNAAIRTTIHMVHWALRREELCDPGLCPDAPEDDGQRCDHCPLDRLDAAQCAEKGLLIRRALDLMGALKLGVHIGIDEIRADEFCAMLIIAEERDLLEREKSPGWRDSRPG